MGYIESNLLPDEKIAYEARLHGIVFWKPLVLVVLGTIFLVIQPIIGMIVLATGLLALIPPFVDYATSEFGVGRWSFCCAMWKRSWWIKA